MKWVWHNCTLIASNHGQVCLTEELQHSYPAQYLESCPACMVGSTIPSSFSSFNLYDSIAWRSKFACAVYNLLVLMEPFPYSSVHILFVFCNFAIFSCWNHLPKRLYRSLCVFLNCLFLEHVQQISAPSAFKNVLRLSIKLCHFGANTHLSPHIMHILAVKSFIDSCVQERSHLGPHLLTRIILNSSMDVITSIIKCEMKLRIHSQTSTVEPLKFGNG